MASHPDTKIDCSKVYVKKSTFSNEQTGDFDGAFAAVPIKEGKRKTIKKTLFKGFIGLLAPGFLWSLNCDLYSSSFHFSSFFYEYKAIQDSKFTN